MSVSGEICLDEVSRGLGVGEGIPHGLFVPSCPDDLTGHFDLTISHPSPEQVQFQSFDRWLAEEAALRGLTCAVLHDGVVQHAIRRLSTGELTIGLHLDYFALWHVAEDSYARLSEAIQDSGGWPINAPARSRVFSDKAAAHGELVRHRLGVPPTVLIRPWSVRRSLTAAERAHLQLDEPGTRVVIKPANSFDGQGIVRLDRIDAEALTAAIATARQRDATDAHLIQREVCSPLLTCDDGVERPASWRVLYCLGDVIPCWWQAPASCHGDASYRRVTSEEMRRHGLGPIMGYMRSLAELCGLNWFSTDLCLSEGTEPSRYHVAGPSRRWPVVAIDSINDQCDVDVQSRCPAAPPDDIVRHVAARFAEAALSHRQTTSPTVIALRFAA